MGAYEFLCSSDSDWEVTASESVDMEFSSGYSPRSSNPIPTMKDKDEVKSTSTFDNLGLHPAHLKRILDVHNQVMKSYSRKSKYLEDNPESLEDAVKELASYKPGTCIEYVGDLKDKDYIIPYTTSLLLVGPKGSGKSYLVNRIDSLFEDDEFAPERAQVSYDISEGNLPEADGTLFIREYNILSHVDGFCLYDTRGLSTDSAENYKRIKHWMTEGICHGEPVCRDSDNSSLSTKMKHKNRKNTYGKSRRIDFVIFVVNAATVLKSIDDKKHNKMLDSAYNCPFLSFRDDRPVVVMTHGDLLSLSERADVRVHLGQLFKINPITQIFDIPDNEDASTTRAMVEMLNYSLERADRNFCVPFLKIGSNNIEMCEMLNILMIIISIFMIWYIAFS